MTIHGHGKPSVEQICTYYTIWQCFNQNLSLCFHGYFSRWTRVSRYQTTSFWTSLELRMTEVEVTMETRTRAKLRSNRHHKQTNTQFFYKPHALPVA